MSFNYNPYKHFEIIVEASKCCVFCTSCLSELTYHNYNISVSVLYIEMTNHVEQSHNRTKEDFEGWSSY